MERRGNGLGIEHLSAAFYDQDSGIGSQGFHNFEFVLQNDTMIRGWFNGIRHGRELCQYPIILLLLGKLEEPKSQLATRQLNLSLR